MLQTQVKVQNPPRSTAEGALATVQGLHNSPRYLYIFHKTHPSIAQIWSAHYVLWYMWPCFFKSGRGKRKLLEPTLKWSELQDSP